MAQKKAANSRSIAVAATVLLFFLSGCATFNAVPAQTALAGPQVDLPTARGSNGLLTVAARVNGAGPFRFLVDTGSDVLIVNSDVAAAAGLKPKGNAILYGTTAKTAAQVAHIDRLESGGLTLTGFDAAFSDSGSNPILHALGVDGILGMPAFRDVVLLVDFGRKQVSVVRRGAQSFRSEAAVSYTGVCPQVTIDVCGRPVPALLDTGSTFAVIIPDIASYPLSYPPLNDEGLGGFGFGSLTGDRRENAQLAGVVRLGPVTWSNPPLRQQPQGQPGNIGIGALDTWKLAFDQHAHLIYFLGPGLHREWPKDKPPEARFRAGFLANLQGTSLRLVEVDAGGAFDLAGLRVGDVILTVDGAPAAEFLSTSSWEAAPMRKLLVARAGSKFEATAIFGPDGAPR